MFLTIEKINSVEKPEKFSKTLCVLSSLLHREKNLLLLVFICYHLQSFFLRSMHFPICHSVFSVPISKPRELELL